LSNVIADTLLNMIKAKLSGPYLSINPPQTLTLIMSNDNWKWKTI